MKKSFFKSFQYSFFIIFFFIFFLRTFTTSAPIIEEYENGNIFFKELNIAGTPIDTTSPSKYIAVPNNSINGNVYYELKDGWSLSEIKLYRRDSNHSLDMFYGALEESENLTELNNVTFGEYETYLYFFIENILEKRKAKLYVLVERFDELNLDFNSLLLNKSYISIETKNNIYNLYYSNDKLEALTQFISIDEFVSDFCEYTSICLRSEVYLNDNNIYTTRYSFSDDILRFKISKKSEIVSICAIVNDTKKFNCLVKN